MGMFIEVQINQEACTSAKGSCKVCVESCPVDIFALKDGYAVVVDNNVDECTLCNLCLDKCPAHAVTLTKLY